MDPVSRASRATGELLASTAPPPEAATEPQKPKEYGNDRPASLRASNEAAINGVPHC